MVVKSRNLPSSTVDVKLRDASERGLENMSLEEVRDLTSLISEYLTTKTLPQEYESFDGFWESSGTPAMGALRSFSAFEQYSDYLHGTCSMTYAPYSSTFPTASRDNMIALTQFENFSHQSLLDALSHEISRLNVEDRLSLDENSELQEISSYELREVAASDLSIEELFEALADECDEDDLVIPNARINWGYDDSE